MTEVSKTCTKCEKTLPLSLFSKDKHNEKDGRISRCKSCRSTYYKKYYSKNKEELKAVAKQAHKRVKDKVFNHYGKACICCGETEIVFLAIDHIGGKGTRHRNNINTQGGSSFYNWIVRNNYPKLFQVLCHNCNWAKYCGGCPHQNTSKLSAIQS